MHEVAQVEIDSSHTAEGHYPILEKQDQPRIKNYNSNNGTIIIINFLANLSVVSGYSNDSFWPTQA